VLFIAAAFFVVAALSGFFKAYIKAFYVSILQELRSKHMRRMQRKSVKMGLDLYESPGKSDKEWMVYSSV
jgi:hypothetical protein